MAMPADPAAASSRAASGDHGRFEDTAEVTFTTHRPRSVVIAQTVASLRPPRREGGPAGRPSRNIRGHLDRIKWHAVSIGPYR
jgi:hypothetical protein